MSELNLHLWSQCDKINGTKTKLAAVIAEIASGVPNAIPEKIDFEYADKVRVYIENLIVE